MKCVAAHFVKIGARQKMVVIMKMRREDVGYREGAAGMDGAILLLGVKWVNSYIDFRISPYWSPRKMMCSTFRGNIERRETLNFNGTALARIR